METTRLTERRSEGEVAIIRYLLGVLPEAEAEHFEQLYLQDEALFEELQGAEDELIDDYANGALSGEDRARFEQHFLRSPVRREKTRLALAMTERAAAWKSQREQSAATADPPSSPADDPPPSTSDPTEKNPPAAKVLSFGRWSRPVPAWREWLAIAAGLLIAIGSATLWFRNRELSRELAAAREVESQSREQAAAESARAAQAESRLGTERDRSNDLNAQVQTLSEQVQSLARQGQAVRELVVRAFVGLEYITSNTRGAGGGKVKTLEVPAGARTVQLGAEFEESRFDAFKAALRRADGGAAWSTTGTLKGRTRGDTQRVTLPIPAARLRAGEYYLTISGVTPDGYTEPVAHYSLKILRR